MKRRSYWRPQRKHRFQVSVRPKIHRRRTAHAGAVFAVLILGMTAALVVRHFPKPQRSLAWPALGNSIRGQLPREEVAHPSPQHWAGISRPVSPRNVVGGGWRAAPGDYNRPVLRERSYTLRAALPMFLRVDDVLVSGAPEALSRQVMAAVEEESFRNWGFWGPYRMVRRLKYAFPCLESVDFKRHWMTHGVEFRVSLRQPLAQAVVESKPEGWLTDPGILCDPPAGTYPQGFWPVVELRGASRPDYPALAQFLSAAMKEGALPSPLARFELRSEEEGWEGWLRDGTHLLWGSLSWTEMKLTRLKEVHGDAIRRFHSGLVVDLRYFANGKILVRSGPNRLKNPAALPKPITREI